MFEGLAPLISWALLSVVHVWMLVKNIRDNLIYLWDISLSKCAEWAKEISRGGRPGRFLDSE